MMATDKIPTKASENRRSNKPIMEKRRRARINNCLNDLKTLILEAMKKDPARHSKLEKADILEMTVKYLQSLQRQQMALAVATDPNVLSKYRAGFSECANEVSRYVSRTDGVEPSVRTRLLNHLTSCLTALSPGIGMGGSTNVVGPVHIQIPGHNASNTSVNLIPPVDLVGGIQLVPSRLPSGEIAFLLPNQAQLPAGQIIPLYSPTVSCSPTTSTSQNMTSSMASSTTITSSATKPLHVAVPSPVSSNTSTLSPVGSDFSDSSSTPTPSPTPSSHRQCLPSPAMEPENLSMRIHHPDISDKLCWRPW